MDRLEFVNWWGYSPAMDLVEEGLFEDDEINVLTVGSGDCRHILETVANNFKRGKKLKFYVVEKTLEQYARHMLLISLLLESQTQLGIQDKLELFLEIHGNTVIRKQTSEYLERASNNLLKMVTDFDCMSNTLPAFDLTNLKHKERDALEGTFKYWRGAEAGDKFDIRKCWDLRLRSYLGSRYDAIPGVFDWHFHMKLVEKDAEIIGSRNYLRWRRSGVAYELREAEYNTTNKTLASAVLLRRGGDRVPTRGYWGDVVLSPYISFGTDCPEKNFFERQNKILTKTSEDVAQHNLTRVIQRMTGRHEPTVDTGDAGDPDSKGGELDYEELENTKIVFLAPEIAPQLHNKSKFKRHFHVIYFGNSQLHNLTKDLAEVFHDKAVLYFETAKFMLDLSAEEVKQFNENVLYTAKSVGCQGPAVPPQNAHARFTYVRPPITVQP